MADGFEVVLTAEEAGFGEFEIRNPLLGFTGTLETVTTSDTEYGTKKYTFNFGSITDVKCSEGYTYEFPVAQVAVNRGKKITKTSPYGILLDSVQRIAPDAKDWLGLVGGTYRVEYTPDHELFNRKFMDDNTLPRTIQGSAWEIVEVVAGAGEIPDGEPQSTEDIALELLNGKTRQQFMLAAMKDSSINADKAFSGNIRNGKWLKSMIESYRVVVDDDGIHAVV